MTDRSPGDVTRLLAAHDGGDPEALGELFQLVYRELRSLARGQRRGPGLQTLDSVALVNECYLKLLRGGGVKAKDRGHFLAVAAQAMRHIVVDYARAHSRAKRRHVRADVEPDQLAMDQQVETILSVHQILDQLNEVDPRLVQVTECRFFAGLSVPATAEALGISQTTVERAWRAVRAHVGKAMTA